MKKFTVKIVVEAESNNNFSWTTIFFSLSAKVKWNVLPCDRLIIFRNAGRSLTVQCFFA